MFPMTHKLCAWTIVAIAIGVATLPSLIVGIPVSYGSNNGQCAECGKCENTTHS